MARYLLRIVLAGLVAIAVLAVLGISEARRPVTVATYRIHAPGLQCGAPPMRVVVMGDLHLWSLVTPPAQIANAVARANALRPDLVVLVGDYFSDEWPTDARSRMAGLVPLAGLKPRIATAAVLGNHDWRDGAVEISALLQRLGISVLHNNALVTPEVAILGIAERTSATANPRLTEIRYAARLAARGIERPPLTLWLAHDPIMFDHITDTGDMLFTGHSHGGQFLPDLTGPVIRVIVSTARALGWKKAGWPAETYVRGFYSAGAKRMIVTSGIGSSVLPLRLGVPPEIDLVEFTGCGQAVSPK